MKIFSLAICTILMIVSFAFSQKIAKPAQTAEPCTDTQKALVEVGVGLHDAGKYDEALRKYQQVVEDNPSCTIALYEMSFTYQKMGDNTRALETALSGAKYKSNELPLFYLTIGNVLDDQGKSDEAIRIYNDAIKILDGDRDMQQHLSSLHFNLGITYRRQKKEKEAREEMKRSIVANQLYASPHLQLADILFTSRYRIPALLAASRFISLEYATARSKRAAAIIDSVMGSTAAKTGTDNKTTISLDLGAPTDEGDFGAAELLMAMVDAGGKGADPPEKNTTPQDMFVTRIEGLIAFLDGNDKKLKNTFSATNYFPFMLEMKRLGYVKPFAYIVLLHNGDPAAANWIKENQPKTAEFLSWAKNYSPR
jgi:Tfp pilus assembly protein PilF